MEPSKERINRARELLREFWAGQRMADAEVEEALELVGSYCRVHTPPLTLVTMVLRQFVGRQAANVAIGQLPEAHGPDPAEARSVPKMRLARMQGVGGCRTV